MMYIKAKWKHTLTVIASVSGVRCVSGVSGTEPSVTTSAGLMSTTASGASHGTHNSTSNVTPTRSSTNSAPSAVLYTGIIPRRDHCSGARRFSSTVSQKVQLRVYPAAQYSDAASATGRSPYSKSS